MRFGRRQARRRAPVQATLMAFQTAFLAAAAAAAGTVFEARLEAAQISGWPELRFLLPEVRRSGKKDQGAGVKKGVLVEGPKYRMRKTPRKTQGLK